MTAMTTDEALAMLSEENERLRAENARLTARLADQCDALSWNGQVKA